MCTEVVLAMDIIEKYNRRIDRRYESQAYPPVIGIDLIQALNYIPVEEVGENFAYEGYTSSKTFYRQGSRPLLEDTVHKILGNENDEWAKVRKLARAFPDIVPHAMLYHKKTGTVLPGNRGLTEEDILELGYGWCNEQARVFCCFAQIAEIPSRLVFAGNPERRYGHTVTEVLLPEGWMMVDQTKGFCFINDGKPIRAVDVYNNIQCREYFEPIYRDQVFAWRKELPAEAVEGMIASDNPLDGYKTIGFCNYFIL
jgi:transglutaminase-like putative cysteine protease